MDHLGFEKNGTVQKMLHKYGNQNEKERVLFSDNLIKINERKKEQSRILLITNEAFYNIGTKTYSKPKIRVSFDKLTCLTASKTSPEFILHCYQEYDFHYTGPHKMEICDLLVKLVSEYQRKPLVLTMVDDKKLHRRAMKTAYASRLRTRESDLTKKHDTREHASDDEDRKEIAVDAGVLADNDKGVTLDDFELLKVLGRGTFGKVMQVRKKKDGKIYAMKILKKSFIIAKGQVENTQAERRLLETLDHPFLTSLRYAFQSKDKLYLVLDFLSGGELFFHLKQNKRFPEPIAKLMVAEIALALGHLHSLGYVYRDLKPENILMEETGHVCLTDFGLAKALYPNTKTNTFCGTPEYLAPEVIQSKGHDKAVDWWSLGILLYELTVGMPPFYSNNVNEMYNKIQTGVLRFPPFLTETCRGIIIKLLNRNPDRRLGSDKDVEDLKQHDFFKGVDWDRLYRKDYDPQYKPDVKGTNNFDRMFTDEPVVDTTSAGSGLMSSINRFMNKSGPGKEKESDESERFRGFTYVVGHNMNNNSFIGGPPGLNKTGSGTITTNNNNSGSSSSSNGGGPPSTPKLSQSGSSEDVRSSQVFNVTQKEEDRELWELEQQFTSFVGLVYPGRSFVRSGPLSKRNRKGGWSEYTFHLFTDVLLYSEVQRSGKFKLHRKIDLKDAAVGEETTESQANLSCFALQSSGKSFVVKAPTPSEKAAWMEDIQSMIMFQKIQLAKQKKESENIKEKEKADGEESDSGGEKEWWEIETAPRAPLWAPDAASPNCTVCKSKFSLIKRRHHCRMCGNVVCGPCSETTRVLEYIDEKRPVRLCDKCAGKPPLGPVKSEISLRDDKSLKSPLSVSHSHISSASLSNNSISSPHHNSASPAHHMQNNRGTNNNLNSTASSSSIVRQNGEDSP